MKLGEHRVNRNGSARLIRRTFLRIITEEFVGRSVVINN
jgi:hypothetical protein